MRLNWRGTGAAKTAEAMKLLWSISGEIPLPFPISGQAPTTLATSRASDG
jgi:hypothetical protein